MIISAFTYNGEKDILDIHLNVLKDHVDQFIICEAPLTFTGKEKPLYFEEVEHLYRHLPIKYHVIDENDETLWEMARNSPNTKGAEHWKREFVHKESIKKALTHLQDDDIVFIGDVDEVWYPMVSKYKITNPIKLKLRVYTYYLNNHSSEQFWGTIVSKYKDIKDSCLNHLRTNTEKNTSERGWHFTSMGGYEAVKKKLDDQYTEESYNTSYVQSNLENNITQVKDFLGRDFFFYTDEQLPRYVLDNKEKFNHLWKQ